MPGVLELLPRDQMAMQKMLDTIRRVFESFGFVPISTPAMELAEVLLTKTGGDTERQVYLAQSTGARTQGHEPELALRFDLTVPLARYVAEHEADLSFPFRRYQIQPVWRGETPQRGRFREFIQCDIDVVDRDALSIRYDAEMPAVISEVFTRLAIGSFTIRLNNRRLLRGLLVELGVDDSYQQGHVLRELDKLDRDGVDAVARALTGRGMATAVVDRLLTMAGPGPLNGAAAIEMLKALPAANDAVQQGRDDLLSVLSMIEMQGTDPDRIAIDLSIARGLDYYTGTVYETTLDGHEDLGSICSGGRYDDLASLYTKSRLPGVGISIGFTRLFDQLRELGLVRSASNVQILVTLIDDDGLATSLSLASDLRRAGFNTEMTMTTGKLSRQLKYADRAGIPLVVIAGEDERQRGTLQLRNLQTKTQIEIPTSDLASTVGRIL
jgi:histidyl-tRNA synthetase